MKHCTKCKKDRPKSDFYFNKKLEKLSCECKECKKAYYIAHKVEILSKRKQHYEEHREGIILKARESRILHSEYFREKAREKYAADKCRIKEHVKMYEKANPKKVSARLKIKYALKKKVITKPNKCEECNEIRRLDAHHEDYDAPLNVMWLCRSCHKRWHSLNGEGRNC